MPICLDLFSFLTLTLSFHASLRLASRRSTGQSRHAATVTDFFVQIVAARGDGKEIESMARSYFPFYLFKLVSTNFLGTSVSVDAANGIREARICRRTGRDKIQ